jgi:hypothetical protein
MRTIPIPEHHTPSAGTGRLPDPPEPATGLIALSAADDRLVLWIFTCTIFVNAALLFLVQPMFSKMVLPLLGGTSAVWTTCMLFFQAALLAGYFYAHVAPRWLGLRRQAVVHLGLLLVSLLTLPIAVNASWAPPVGSNPVPALLALLAVSLGIPFFLLSSGSPLLQKWFSHTRHPSASNPYFLYAASNLGSMIALLGYPLLLEPRLRLMEQSAFWTYGYWLLVALTVGCAVSLWRRTSLLVLDPESAALREAGPVSPGRRMRWVALAFVPSSLLLGVTTFLTTDIAAVPLLWVLPLALYLLTFVIVFASRPPVRHELAVRVQPFTLLPLVIAMFLGAAAWPTALLPLHLAAFFIAALVCHGELARTKPEVRHLTEFYLWISVGGVLGGVFNVLIAPQLFQTVAEYPLALVLAALLRPPPAGRSTIRDRRLDLVLPAALGAVMIATQLVQRGEMAMVMTVAIGCLAGLVCFSFSGRPLRFGLGLGALLLAGALVSHDREVLLVERSFFGVHRIEHDPAGGYHRLFHGSTLHGAQSLDPARRLEPLTYYHREGPVGQMFAELPLPPAGRRVAVVGLGTGSIACYGRPGERWTYYEIDPVVERIARDRRYFTFLSDCPPEVDIVLGDARLTVPRAAAGSYDLIVLDAFSSDAIPIHLVTREALGEYLDKLTPGGAIAFHISNRHLDLEPVLARIARDANLVGRLRRDRRGSERDNYHADDRLPASPGSAIPGADPALHPAGSTASSRRGRSRSPAQSRRGATATAGQNGWPEGSLKRSRSTGLETSTTTAALLTRCISIPVKTERVCQTT